MSGVNIVILDYKTLGDTPLTTITPFGKVIVHQVTSQSEVPKFISDADIVLNIRTNLNAENMSQAKRLKYIGVMGTGFNNVDIDYCKEHNIVVTNVPGYSTNSVAQVTFSLLLELLNHTSKLSEYTTTKYATEGISMQENSIFDFKEICNKKWCVVGYGKIGRQVSRIAEAFGAQVSYFSTTEKHDDEKMRRVTYEEMVTESDIITIHCPLNAKTKYLFGTSAFLKMKKDVVIINVARGGVVNTAEIVEALNNNTIGGYGTDVYEVEPIDQNSPFFTLKDMKKVVFTPHIGWTSEEARRVLMSEVGKNIEAYLKGERRNVVN
ncbi:2-hydroxyacid dehydrogenase, putative [Entamoeba invadens IP1]|uniref:2-hydroxyacid dehydrogenase, putative n=1 Tax=Entamoeba invadens IP1 TaxID=370355 RepID=A0A0A1U3U8_ENTIV|nr:2-hydroxyacid dehydrogenase, putative [Entamoeba invadens IP1]ELP88836.1 2-hydroxyacid dehydrogenase, putative [Entamoeba invadens IP1]|eukprot:XP_004255607.1 2-hydroxyacid dehydrogenase, putative [Entamoeba invadens IP1]